MTSAFAGQDREAGYAELMVKTWVLIPMKRSLKMNSCPVNAE